MSEPSLCHFKAQPAPGSPSGTAHSICIKSCFLQTAGKSLLLGVNLEGRAQNCARRAAWRDQKVSIVLTHTDITAHSADPQSRRRQHYGPGHLHHDQSTQCVQGISETSRVCRVVSRSLLWPVRDTSNMGTYP